MSDIAITIFNMKDIIDFQKESVVSKTLIKKDKGTVTTFAFDEGQGLSEHTAPFDALVQILEGNATITISRRDYEICAGQMMTMPANQPHAIKAKTPVKMLLTMIRE